MKDQLISFDVAKLAKEKGFKEYCIAYFSISGEEMYFREDGMYFYSNGANGRLILRPTQSLLQKWLREEHKLSVEVYFNNGWDYDICDLETNLQNISKPYEYKTFENAFEVALMTALNMIKQDFA